MNSDKNEGEVDVTHIDSKNETNIIYMNHDVNVLHKYYVTFLSLNNQEDVYTGT